MFSTFGNTLTKRRNRLSTTTLVQLSEVKMHLRNEHLMRGTKTRLRRQFEARAPIPDVEQPLVPGGPRAARTASRDQLATIIDMIGELPEGQSEFAEIVAQQVQMVEADEDNIPQAGASADSAPSQSPAAHSADSDDSDCEDDEQWKVKQLSEIFDFSGDVWSRLYSPFTTLSFDEELGMYDLVAADGDGEIENDSDDTTQDILANYSIFFVFTSHCNSSTYMLLQVLIICCI
ncbi:hypothetical protein D9619_000485 [Psilocybe cf. subviscida]|uniref:Uncharacterized protein n=1 Tax=Psilocybe cf. subviscida TaxID=2480587 RepID=A0A8H5BEJ4_9AGAR|nr:hypothetical protein D9619_000485 [Psilocybe cf. subviscida]